MFRILRRITSSPVLNIAVGLIFFGTGMVEIYDGFAEESMGIGAHHGAALFGALHAIKFLPDLFEGMEYIQKRQ